MRYAAFKGPRSQHVEKLWMIGSCLEVPEVLGAFVLVALTSIVFASTKKTAGNGVPMSCMAVAGLWLLTIQRQTAPIPTSQPRCYVLHIFFSCWDWCTSWLEGGHGKTFHMFLLFWQKKSEDFRRFSGWGFGFHWFSTSRQVDGATPVIFPSSLLTSAPWCRWFFVATPWLLTPPVLEVTTRFWVRRSWKGLQQSFPGQAKKKKITSKMCQGCLYGCFVLSILISWITYVAYVKSLLGLWKYLNYICLVILLVHFASTVLNRMCDVISPSPRTL